MPAQLREERQEQWPALPEECRPAILRLPVQARPGGNDQSDRVEFSIITDSDGRYRTWSFYGVDRASRAISRPILSCGLVVALIVVAAIAVLAHTSMLDKVICGMGGVVVAGLVAIGARAKQWLKGRSHDRRDKASSADASRG